MAIACTVVREDESTTSLDVDSLSVRGAQREITGWLISQGYVPAGRWTQEFAAQPEVYIDAEPAEYVRQFKPGTEAQTV